VDHYQQENIVTDPVGGMQLNKLFAPAHTEHQGQAYYFCVDECRQKFAQASSCYIGRKSS
jgi:YHS domain-containing protein